MLRPLFLVVTASVSFSQAFISGYHKPQHTKMQSSPKEEVSSPNGQYRIGYASDIEGHWDYFLDYVSRSNVLDWEKVPSSRETKYDFHRLALRPNTYFVFGGDSVDKGPGDIRFTRALVDLKQRYGSCSLVGGQSRFKQVKIPYRIR
jgi:hypothetical protein